MSSLQVSNLATCKDDGIVPWDRDTLGLLLLDALVTRQSFDPWCMSWRGVRSQLLLRWIINVPTDFSKIYSLCKSSLKLITLAHLARGWLKEYAVLTAKRLWKGCLWTGAGIVGVEQQVLQIAMTGRGSWYIRQHDSKKCLSANNAHLYPLHLVNHDLLLLTSY